ncbi:MAG: sporulation protein YqfD [Oscillospiraceae bacterium]|nr:sporulation protein YqfD [Oscillospiraceae bacterium]
MHNIFKNTVDFCAEGAECEKLLSHCVKNGIEIEKPRKKGFRLYGCVKANKYKKLRCPAKKYGLKLKILRKSGYYFILKKNKIKTGFALGMCFVFAVVQFMNLFIWEINVVGNKNISTESIVYSAKEKGLKPGTLAKKHDVQTIEWYIMSENDGLAVAEVNIQGSCANIMVREAKEPAESKPDDDIPINIVASRYGVIRSMDVFDGQSCAKVGDAVMKGDMLVSAVYEDRHNKLTLKHARANVIAETDYCIEVEFPLEQTLTSQGKNIKTVTEIEFLGSVFRIGSHKNTEELIKEKEEKTLYFLWIKLPINVIITRYFDVKSNNITYNFDQGRDGAFELLEEMEEKELFDAEIISRIDYEKVKNNKYIIKSDYICLMNIAEEQPIESDIPWENTDDIS